MDDDEQLICYLVDQRYSAMREARRLEIEAAKLIARAKGLKADVKHITLKKIAEKFGTTDLRVWDIAKANGVDMSGVKVPTNKTKILDMKRSGMSYAEIGHEIGVTRQRAQQIVREAECPDFKSR